MPCLHVDKVSTPVGCVCQECGLLFSAETVVDALAQNSRGSHKKKRIVLRHVAESAKPSREKENFAQCSEMFAQMEPDVWRSLRAHVEHDLGCLNFPKNRPATLRYALTLFAFYTRRVKSTAGTLGFDELRRALRLSFKTITNVKRFCDFNHFPLVDEMRWIAFEIDVVFHQFDFEPDGHEWIVRLFRLLPQVSCPFDSSAVKMATLYFLAFHCGVDVTERVKASPQYDFLFESLSLIVFKLTWPDMNAPFSLHFLPQSHWLHFEGWKERVFNFLEQSVTAREPHQLARFF